MKTPTLAQFKRFSRDIAPAARAVLMARVFAQVEKERVDTYIRPIFDRYAFRYGSMVGDWKGGPQPGDPIMDPKNLYLCTDEELLAQYYEDCDTAHRAHGFTGPQGHCPALIAENLVIKVERALLELGGELFGVNFADTYGENRVKALELLIGAGVKAAA